MNPHPTLHHSIEDCLGPSTTRFFGEGYRRVGSRLGELSVRPAPSGGAATATAGVRYPADWSVREAADAPRPHLSTIDTLVLAVQTAEAYLTHAFGLTAEQRRRSWLRGFSMRAGARPQEDLLDIPVTATALHTLPARWGLCAAVTSFEVRIGAMRVELAVEHDIAAPNGRTAAWAAADDLLGDPDARYYGRAFTRRPQRVAEVAVDGPAGRVTALVACGSAVAGAAAPGADPTGPGEGFAAAYEPSLSMVDGIVATAQMAQAVMYAMDGVERRQTGTLWMRRLAMTAKTPYQPLDNAFVCSLSVRRRLLGRGAEDWRMYEVAALFQGIAVSSSVAYAVHA
ncbi:AvrD family protein [Actinacidiphila sp. ITFR-21]|uniref:AvrD family protein n=1 Tax=Actinacidiphila sp. ITFR-21 TaxID=3075199 RepID=UPI00288973D7|nr:AvrD family protein [Streptomyces sp. ITFR-21]WNI15074.1 AvrD family protein [Streptomyces sp. ITFR-21]